MSILGAVTGRDPEALAAAYEQYGPLKSDAADAVVALLEPIQQRVGGAARGSGRDVAPAGDGCRPGRNDRSGRAGAGTHEHRPAPPLTVMPGGERLLLAVVEAAPTWHPEHATFQPFPVHAWLVRHPDGPILVDCGVGIGHTLIDEWYHPPSHQSVLIEAGRQRVGR